MKKITTKQLVIAEVFLGGTLVENWGTSLRDLAGCLSKRSG